MLITAASTFHSSMSTITQDVRREEGADCILSEHAEREYSKPVSQLTCCVLGGKFVNGAWYIHYYAETKRPLETRKPAYIHDNLYCRYKPKYTGLSGHPLS